MLFISQVTVLAQTISESLCVVYFTGHSPGTDNVKEFVCCLFHRSQSWHRQYQRVCVLFISQVTVLAQTISKSLCVVYFTGHSPGTDNIKEFVCCLFHSHSPGTDNIKEFVCCLFHRSQSWHRQHQRVCVLFISQVTVLAQTTSKSLCVVYFTGHSPGTDNIKEFVCCLFHRSQSWHRQHQRVCVLFISQVTVLAQTTSRSLCVVYFTGHSPGTDNIKEFVCCLFHRSQSWLRQRQRVCVLFISQVTVLAQTTSKSLCVVYFTGHSPGTDNIKEFVCCLFHRPQSWHRQHQRVCVLFISQVTVLAQTTSKSLCVVYFTGHSPGTDNIKEFVCCLFHRSQSWHRQHQRVCVLFISQITVLAQTTSKSLCVVYFTGHSPGTDNIKEFVCCLFHRSQSWHRQHQRHQRVCVLFISQATVLAQTTSKSLCVVYFTGHSPGSDNVKEFVCCLFHRFISQVTVLAQTTSKSLCVVYFTGHSPGTDNIKEFVCCLFHRSQSWHRQHQRVCVLFISQVTVLAQTTSKSLCVVYFTGHSPGTDNIKEFVCCLFHRSQSWHRQHQGVCVLFISQVTVLAQTTSKSLCVVYFTGHSPGTDNIKEFVYCLFHRPQSWHRQHQRVCVLFISQATVLAQTTSKSLCVVYFTGHSPGTDNIKEFVCCLFHRSQSWHRQHQRVCVLFISQPTVLAQTTSKSLCVVYFTGHSPGTDNIKEFASLTQQSSVSGLCDWTDPPVCLAIPVKDLQWRLHGRHWYYVSLKLEGINGLDRVASSDVYEHYRGPPYGGMVVELPLSTAELVGKCFYGTALKS